MSRFSVFLILVFLQTGDRGCLQRWRAPRDTQQTSEITRTLLQSAPLFTEAFRISPTTAPSPDDVPGVSPLEPELQPVTGHQSEEPTTLSPGGAAAEGAPPSTLAQKPHPGTRQHLLRRARTFLAKPFRHARRLVGKAGRWIGRKVVAASVRFVWRRLFAKMVNRMGALVRTQWKMEDQVTYGCDIVASFVVRRRSSGGSPEEQPVEITAIINKLFPQAVSVPLKSRITKVATVVKRGDFVGLTPYGSVLYKLESLNSGPETLLEAFPIVVGPTGVSDSVKKETVQAMNMIRAATSGLSAYGIPLDLMMLKKASGIWCPSTYSDPAIIPNVFMRRLLLKTLREVLIDMAVEAATETPGRGPLHEARLCLTKQVNEAKMVSFNTRAARGRISIDTVFVSSNGAVHVQAQFPSEPAPALSVGAATAADQRPPQTSTGALRDSNEDVDAAADTALTSEVTFAIVLAQIWCPSRQFDEVAQEVVSYHQSKRQLSNEFFEKCAAVPNSIRDVIAEAAL